MKISIITVCYNSAATIGDTIHSVLAQSYPDIEYIVVDGASSDDTVALVTLHPEIKLISEPDEGIYDAMNKGIEAATGDWIGILNADDFYADDHVIADVVKTIENSSAEGCYADLDYVDEQNTERIMRKWVSGEYKPGSFRSGWMPPHPTFFVKKEVFARMGNYVTTFSISADYELMLRFIHKHEIKLCYLPRTIIKMRTGGKSGASLKNRITSTKEDLQAWKMNELKPPALLTLKKKLIKVDQFLKK